MIRCVPSIDMWHAVSGNTSAETNMRENEEAEGLYRGKRFNFFPQTLQKNFETSSSFIVGGCRFWVTPPSASGGATALGDQDFLNFVAYVARRPWIDPVLGAPV